MARRRILVAVQPRVLRDALGEVLERVGLDEVLVSEGKPADRSPMPYDAAIVSEVEDVRADVVIEVDDDGDGTVGRVRSRFGLENVPLRTPEQLLVLLDRVCPTSAARVGSFGGAHG